MNYTKQELLWIWLAAIDGMTVTDFYRLLEQYGDVETLYLNASAKDPKMECVEPALKERIFACRKKEFAYSILEEADKLHSQIITRISNGYPHLLQQIPDAPLFLYVKGAKDIGFEKTIGMVGTRNCTQSGIDCAKYLAANLSRNGVCIVSGLARGIDSAAHQGALEGKTPTLAILACGIDTVYPRENDCLADRIIEQGGALITEYKPGMAPLPANFPVRNRIISGLSRGVVIVEAPEKSGAMITVRHANDQGREVFVTPGSILNANNRGSNQLLSDGAILVMDYRTVLDEYGWECYDQRKDPAKIKIDEEFKAVYDIVQKGERSYDELSALIGLPPQQLSSLLTMMELKGLIQQLPGRMFCIKREC
ncbi:MAG: DNA-processing protein DprA [Christensenellales bacterium]